MFKLPKVELHLHLDGACDLALLQEMCRADKLDEDRFHFNDIDQFRKVVSLTEPQKSLVDFLKPFPDICYILSTKNNLKKQSIDICRLQAESNVVYTEIRHSPHFFTERGMTTDEATVAVLDGIEEGEKKYGVKVRCILSFVREYPEWSNEITELAIKYKDRGIVGVDIEGPEVVNGELKPTQQQHIKAFQKARDAGLHVTAHAAESGPASFVTQAINELHATRIGHGYHVLEDDAVYQLAKSADVHFETCLTSSIYTNSSSFEKHAIRTFARDKVNFGLNTDDPCLISTTLNKEFSSAQRDLGLTEEQLIECVYNAARSCFLPENEKKELIEDIDKKIDEYRKHHVKQ